MFLLHVRAISRHPGPWRVIVSLSPLAMGMDNHGYPSSKYPSIVYPSHGSGEFSQESTSQIQSIFQSSLTHSIHPPFSCPELDCTHSIHPPVFLVFFSNRAYNSIIFSYISGKDRICVTKSRRRHDIHKLTSTCLVLEMSGVCQER